MSNANTWTGKLQLSAIALLIVGYAVLSHYSNSSPDTKGLAAGLSLAPVFLIGVVLAWRWGSPLIAALIVLVIAHLVYHFWPLFERNYEWADLVQQFAAYGLIALSFARSLLSGRVPLCTLLARQLHGELTHEEVSYTRHATAAWAVFYTLTATAVVVLFLLAPLRVWSLFVNFAVFGLIGIMVIADYAIRRHVLPHRPGAGIVAALRQALIG